MNREQDPATEKQVALIQELGLTLPPGCTVAQASDIIGTAQIIRNFALQIARQEWRADISGYDLRPIIRSVLWTPEMADEIHDIMDAQAQAAFTAREEEEQIKAAGASSPDITPDLHEDKNYSIVKAKLEYHFPDLKQMNPRLTTPHPPPRPKVYLPTDSGILESVKTWVDGFRGKK